MKIKTKKIYGERIYLRQLTEADASSNYSSWLNDHEVNKYLATRKITINELRKYIKEKNASGSCLLLGIFCKEEHIGNIKLEAIDHKKGTAEMGILIGNKNYWGKGIGKEATKLVLDYAFGELNLNEICLGVVSGNKAAIKLYEDVGFETRKINKKARNHDGVVFDEIIMTIRNDKYKTTGA